jgi:hypothetical protein
MEVRRLDVIYRLTVVVEESETDLAVVAVSADASPGGQPVGAAWNETDGLVGVGAARGEDERVLALMRIDPGRAGAFFQIPGVVAMLKPAVDDDVIRRDDRARGR